MAEDISKAPLTELNNYIKYLQSPEYKKAQTAGLYRQFETERAQTEESMAKFNLRGGETAAPLAQLGERQTEQLGAFESNLQSQVLGLQFEGAKLGATLAENERQYGLQVQGMDLQKQQVAQSEAQFAKTFGLQQEQVALDREKFESDEAYNQAQLDRQTTMDKINVINAAAGYLPSDKIKMLKPLFDSMGIEGPELSESQEQATQELSPADIIIKGEEQVALYAPKAQAIYDDFTEYAQDLNDYADALTQDYYNKYQIHEWGNTGIKEEIDKVEKELDRIYALDEKGNALENFIKFGVYTPDLEDILETDWGVKSVPVYDLNKFLTKTGERF